MLYLVLKIKHSYGQKWSLQLFYTCFHALRDLTWSRGYVLLPGQHPNPLDLRLWVCTNISLLLTTCRDFYNIYARKQGHTS